MNKYKILLWDVDNTLLDFNRSMYYAITTSFNKFNLPINEDVQRLYAQINEKRWKLFELKSISKEEVIFGRFRELFKELKITSVSPEEFEEVYQEELGNVYFYLDHSDEVFQSLIGKYKQFLVTNGLVLTQENKLRLSGFYDWADGVFISDKIGAHKPCKEFFDACFAQIKGFKLEDAMIIGDSLTSDIRGGNNAGITTCWYNPNRLPITEDVKVDYEIHSLKDVLTILEE